MASEPKGELQAHYPEVVRAPAKEKRGASTPEEVIASEAELVLMGHSWTLAQELVRNELRCRRNLGMRVHKSPGPCS